MLAMVSDKVAVGLVAAIIVLLAALGYFVYPALNQSHGQPAPQSSTIAQPGQGSTQQTTLTTLPSTTISPSTYPTTTIRANTTGTQAQPWQMFHGGTLHTGYAGVAGPQSGGLKWKFQAGTGTGNPPTSIAISSKDIIYLSGAAAVYALNSNGSLLWQRSYPGPQGPALSSDGATLYFVANQTIFALYTSNGTQKWAYATGGKTIFGPTVGPDGTVYQGSWDTYFYAISSSGALKWRYKTAGAVSYPSSIGTDGTIFLGAGDAHAGPDPNVYAFYPNGTLRWKYNTTSLRVGSPAISSNGTIYAPADPTLFALNPNTGGVIWRIPAAGTCGPPPLPPCGKTNQTTIIGIITPALGPDGTLYTGTSAGTIYAVSPKTQKIIWKYQTGPLSTNSSRFGLPGFPLVDSQGDSFFGAEDGKMYAMTKNGTVLWTYQTGGPITEASPALGPDGTLYFTSTDGYLYAV